MTVMDQAIVDELKEPSQFKQEWEAKKLLKRTLKKAKRQLNKQGFSKSQANTLVKQSLKRITTNKPERKAAGRGS